MKFIGDLYCVDIFPINCILLMFEELLKCDIDNLTEDNVQYLLKIGNGSGSFMCPS